MVSPVPFHVLRSLFAATPQDQQPVLGGSQAGAPLPLGQGMGFAQKLALFRYEYPNNIIIVDLERDCR